MDNTDTSNDELVEMNNSLVKENEYLRRIVELSRFKIDTLEKENADLGLDVFFLNEHLELCEKQRVEVWDKFNKLEKSYDKACDKLKEKGITYVD